MNRQANPVRARQEALRALYAKRPQAATIHKRVRTGPADGADPFHSTVTPENLAHPERPYGMQWRCGPDEAVGGLHDVPNPGELLCGALAGCFDGTVRMLAGLLGIELDELEVEATATMDVRGALAIEPDIRVGLQSMQLAASRCGDAAPPNRAARTGCRTLLHHARHAASRPTCRSDRRRWDGGLSSPSNRLTTPPRSVRARDGPAAAAGVYQGRPPGWRQRAGSDGGYLWGLLSPSSEWR
jgi:hypothetical protein